MIERIGRGFIKTKSFIFKRKIVSILILVVIVFSIYKLFFSAKTSAQAVYSIEKVSTHDVTATVSETGQISANGSVDVKSQVSGTINSIRIKAGDKVTVGELLAIVDSSDGYTTLQQAKLAYENAQLNYQKATSPESTTSIMSADIDFQNLQNNLTKSYDDTSLELSNTYIDLSSIMSSLHDAIYVSSINSLEDDVHFYGDYVAAIERKYGLVDNSDNYVEQALISYPKLKTEYDTAFTDYKGLSNSTDDNIIYTELENTIDLLKNTLASLKNYSDLIQDYQTLSTQNNYNIEPKSTIALNNFKTYQNTIGNHLATLISYKNTINSNNLSIQQQEITVNQVKTGDTGLALESDELALEQAKLSYDEALSNYNKYFITSPITGEVSSVSSIVGQDAGSAMIATIITNGKSADLSVPEADISKIVLGESTTLSFDALEGFLATGTVSEITQSGSVSSGVVSYTVKVSFNDPKNQVKPGMSVTADILTGKATNTLAVPTDAVKSTFDGKSYVEVFPSMNSLQLISKDKYTATSSPIRIPVTVGLVGEKYTEIQSGLKEGDIVSVKINTTSGTTNTNNTSNIPTKNTGSFGGGANSGARAFGVGRF